MKSLAETGLGNLGALSEASGLPVGEIRDHLRMITAANELPAALESLGISYMAPGDAARTGLADHSIDMVYSYGVLEHIEEDSLDAMMKESVRVLVRGGRSCHNIGLHDHFSNAGLGNAVNFLQYSDRFWSFFCGNSLLYHNRLRESDYLRMFDRHGLKVEWIDTIVLESDIDALRRLRIHSKFANRSERDLAAAAMYVDLVPDQA